MNKKLTTELISFLLVSVMIGFSACVKDTCKQLHTYTYYEAVYKTKEEVRANIKSNPARSIENPGKIYTIGKYIFLNDVDKGIHVIDNTNPSLPKNIFFIDIPGNVDIAVKGNILYADLYTDLVAIDISNPASVRVEKIVDGIFPDRYYGNGFVRGDLNNDQIITDWVKRDTTFEQSCEQQDWFMGRADVFLASAEFASGSKASSPIGAGGSMARFAIMNDRLYTVNTSDLDVFNIANARDPQRTNTVNIGWGIETIYPFRDKLFIGSQSGMFIFETTNADAPSAAGQFSHVTSCDPVIADDEYAYITLRSGTACQGFTNQLDIVKLNNLNNLVLQKTYTLNNPHGLSKDGELLFICDGDAGLKIYNASNVLNLQLVKEITDIDTYDVIAMNKVALVIAKDGLYQYDYSNLANIRLLSKISVSK